MGGGTGGKDCHGRRLRLWFTCQTGQGSEAVREGEEQAGRGRCLGRPAVYLDSETRRGHSTDDGQNVTNIREVKG